MEVRRLGEAIHSVECSGDQGADEDLQGLAEALAPCIYWILVVVLPGTGDRPSQEVDVVVVGVGMAEVVPPLVSHLGPK